MRLAGHGIRCVRGGREVFSGLDFAVRGGEALAITGENGSGKTSLLRQIAGLLAMPAGKITLDGGDKELTIIEQAHYLAHRDPMKPSLTVIENLQFWAEFLGGAANSPVDCIAAVGLSHATLLPAGFCPLASGGDYRSRACSPCIARSGCSMSRLQRSMPAVSACSPA